MRSQEGLESSGGPVRIICTKFRSIPMVGERAMIENPILKKVSGVIVFMRSVFMYFLLWVKYLVTFLLGFGFLMKNCIHGRLETSEGQNLNQKTGCDLNSVFCCVFHLFLFTNY